MALEEGDKRHLFTYTAELQLQHNLGHTYGMKILQNIQGGRQSGTFYRQNIRYMYILNSSM